ncbi:MAG: hypothetical protein QOD06_1635 [Candidatus Binatota bacterium]|jgi:hypothetical protein|nr:hypothetical protein [Candidatus Binatota bacterium]
MAKIAFAAQLLLLGALLVLPACVSEGPGADFDRDGLHDLTEDTNENFLYDPPESDFDNADTDYDGVCDGLPSGNPDAAVCARCEDCNDNGLFEPCLTESDPLNDDTDNDGIGDAQDGSPAQGYDCASGNPQLQYGSSLPPGKPFPPRRTATPIPQDTPIPPAPTPTPVR